MNYDIADKATLARKKGPNLAKFAAHVQEHGHRNDTAGDQTPGVSKVSFPASSQREESIPSGLSEWSVFVLSGPHVTGRSGPEYICADGAHETLSSSNIGM
jgi:hypothetical protein